MKTKLISSQCEEHNGYGAGSGDTERYEYECPCGKGRIIEEHDNIPGFRDHDVYINCIDCSKKYKLDISKGVKNWEVVIMTNLDLLYKAIDEKKIVELVADTKEKGEITRLCIPFDYAISSRYKDNQYRFHFYDLNSPSGNHVLSLLPEQVISITITDKEFDPEKIVTWTPDWTYKRNWGAKS